MEFEMSCRVCLKTGEMISIFETHTTENNVKVLCSDMLSTCATVTVSKDDNFPKQLCMHCFDKLCSAYSFRQLCEATYAYLIEYNSKENVICEIKQENEEEKHENNDQYILMKNENCVKYEDYMDEDNFVKDEDLSTNSSSDSPKIKIIKKKKNLNEKKTRKKSKKSDSDKGKKISGYKCSYCPKVLSRKFLVQPHEDAHLGIKRFFCDICQKHYRCERNHMSIHKRGNKFKCEICSKYFNTKTKLRLHIETHRKDREKKYGCDVEGCTKSYLSAVALERHSREAHGSEKEFMCHLCSKDFTNVHNLESHLLRHTGDKTLKCSYCEKMFYKNSARLSHELKHTNTRNYSCTQCDKKFTLSWVLKKHMLCHKERKEECRICGKKFARRDNRRNHELAMHGIAKCMEEKT